MDNKNKMSISLPSGEKYDVSKEQFEVFRKFFLTESHTNEYLINDFERNSEKRIIRYVSTKTRHVNIKLILTIHGDTCSTLDVYINSPNGNYDNNYELGNQDLRVFTAPSNVIYKYYGEMTNYFRRYHKEDRSLSFDKFSNLG